MGLKVSLGWGVVSPWRQAHLPDGPLVGSPVGSGSLGSPRLASYGVYSLHVFPAVPSLGKLCSHEKPAGKFKSLILPRQPQPLRTRASINAEPRLLGGSILGGHVSWIELCTSSHSVRSHTPQSSLLFPRVPPELTPQALLLGPLMKKVSEPATWLPTQGAGQGSLCAHLSQELCWSSFHPLNQRPPSSSRVP